MGAIVCFALYLSHVCPIKYDLLFERFLDENRKEAPDIDIDFCKERRGEIIRYVKEKYGEANVAQIGTFGTLQAKAAIKDVGRALGIPLGRVSEITEMVPDELKITIDKAIGKNEELKKVYDPEIPVDIYELGLIYKVDINDDRHVDIEMTLTAPACPVAGEMPVWVEDAARRVEGV